MRSNERMVSRFDAERLARSPASRFGLWTHHHHRHHHHHQVLRWSQGEDTEARCHRNEGKVSRFDAERLARSPASRFGWRTRRRPFPHHVSDWGFFRDPCRIMFWIGKSSETRGLTLSASCFGWGTLRRPLPHHVSDWGLSETLPDPPFLLLHLLRYTLPSFLSRCLFRDTLPPLLLLRLLRDTLPSFLSGGLHLWRPFPHHISD